MRLCAKALAGTWKGSSIFHLLDAGGMQMMKRHTEGVRTEGDNAAVIAAERAQVRSQAQDVAQAQIP